MENEKKFLQTLLNYKSDQHPSSEHDKDDKSDKSTPPIVQEFFLDIPKFDKHLLEQKFKDYKNIKQLLLEIQFEYGYDYQKLSQLPFLQINKSSEKLIILICFQLISYVYFTKSRDEEKDFKLFIVLMIHCIQFESDKNWLIDFSFKILMNHSLQNNSSALSKDNAAYVITFFTINKNLTSDFYPIFIDFSKQIINNNDDNFDFRRNIVIVIDRFLSENRKILKTAIEKQKFKEIYELNRQLLTKFDRTALHVITEISKLQQTQPKMNNNFTTTSPFEQELKMIPPLFTTKANQVKMNIEISKTKIHDIPSSIKEYIDIQKQAQNSKSSPKFEPEINQQNVKLKISSSSVLFVDEDNFYGKLDIPPSELCVEPFLLFNQMNQELKELAFLFSNFVNQLNKKYVKNIFNETMNVFSLCNSADCYGAFAAFLMTLHLIDDKEICINYLPALLNDLLFSPDHTIFGPYLLDPTINLFRSIFVDMIYEKAPILLHDHLKYFLNQPFMFAEIIGRYYYKIPVKLLLFDEDFELISQVNNALRFLKAPPNARSTIISFIFSYLRNPETFINCLSSKTFIDHFFKIIFEKSLGEMFLLSVLSQSFAQLEIDYSDSLNLNDTFVSKISSTKFVNYRSLLPLRDFLYQSAKSYDQIDQIIFTFIANICRLRPNCVQFFRPFLELMIDKCSILHSKESTKNAISYLTSLLTFYSQNESFNVDPYVYKVLIQNIEYISYTDILNLVAESTVTTTNSLFLMKRPIFLPLLFIKYSKDINQIHRIIKHLLTLADVSQHNCRALHDGKIDLLLLHILGQDPLININGYLFDMTDIIEGNKTFKSKSVTRMLIHLIKLICLSKSNGEIAKYFTSVITSLHSTKVDDSKLQLMDLTLDVLGSILLELSGEPANRYEIGNISEICTIEGLNSNIFDKDFSFSFMLKVDQLFFKYSASVIELITFCNKSDQVFSICIINGILCAKFHRGDLQTKVLLCPRLIYNHWDYYSIIFKKIKSESGKYEYSINTYRNMERLHNSDFCDIKLDYGQINIKIGGFIEKVKGPKIKNYNKLCGFISSIRLYNRCISKNEIHRCISQSSDAPNDYFFSTLSECNFPSHEDIKLKNNFKILIRNTKLNLSFSREMYDIEMLDDCICHFEHYYIRSLLNEYMTKTAENLNINSKKIVNYSFLSKTLSLLRFVLRKSTNQHLSSDFASILFNNPDSISFEIFESIVELVNSIENKVTKFYWLEDVVFSFALWEKSRSNFNYILKSISNKLIQYKPFLRTKSYFSYFLIYFNKHINDQQTIDDFTEFMGKLAFIHLTYDDCNLLFSYYFNSTNKINYIRLIFIISSSKSLLTPFLELKYPISNHLLVTMKEEIKNNKNNNSDELIQIIVYTILCLNCLYQNGFHSIIPQIMILLHSVDMEKLFIELEKHANDYPNLFSLITAIAFTLKLDEISVIPDFLNSVLPLIKSMKSRNDYNFLWFIYPLFYSMLPTTKESTRSLIFDFISMNAVFTSIFTGINVINDVVSLVMLISYKVNYYSLNDFDPICLLLTKMTLFSREIPEQNRFYSNVIFILLQNSIMALFYNLNGKHFQDEICKDRIHKKSMKMNLTNIQDLSNLFEKVQYEKFTFCYNLEIDKENNTITYRFLLNQILFLSEVLIKSEFEIPGIPNIKSGIFSSEPKFTFKCEDLIKILKHFQDIHKEIEELNTFEHMNQIFEFFEDKITLDFTNVIKNMSQIVINSFHIKELVSNDHDKMVNFEHNELQRIAELLKLTIDDKVQIIHDPTLNDRYYSHLLKRKKSCNRNIIRFPIDLSQQHQNSINSEKVQLISLDRITSCFLEVKENEIYLTNFSNNPNGFKKIPFIMITNIIYINSKTVLILTHDIFNKSYLIEFYQSNSSFFDKVKRVTSKKRNISSSLQTSSSNNQNSYNFQLFSSKSEVVQTFSDKSRRFWSNHKKISAFDYLNIVNLMSGRTYISSQLNYPIFPSTEMLKGDLNSNLNDEEKQKKMMELAKPEDYFFFDSVGEGKSDSLLTVYENRKLLESKSSMNSISMFVNANFQDILKAKEESDKLNSANNLQQQQLIHQETETELESIESSSSSFIDQSHLSRISSARCSIQELEIKVNPFHGMKSQRSVLKPKIKYASVLRMKNKQLNAFCIVYNTGLISFINVTFDGGGNAKCDEFGTRTNRISRMNMNSLHFSSINKGVIVYDDKSMLTVTQDGDIEKKNVFFEQHLFNHSIFLRTPSIVSQSLDQIYDQFFIKPPIKPFYTSSLNSSSNSSSKRNFLDSVRDLCFVSHKVLCIALNENMKIFALGCDDCKVRIRNLATGKKIKTVSLLTKFDDNYHDDIDDDGIPRKILITNRCGFVVVNTLYRLFIFSVNGTLLQCVNDFPKIAQWFSFCSPEGFDFVGFEIQEKPYCVFFFEALKPSERKFINVHSNHSQSKIISIHFDATWNAFIVLSSDGKIHILPFN